MPDFAFVRIDHVQLALPPGEEPATVAFYEGVLGLAQVPKPEPMASRGGAWFRAGDVFLHLGVEADFHPAKKAHPALVVDDIEALAEHLLATGHEARWSDDLPDRRQLYTDDPFGNRLEFLSP